MRSRWITQVYTTANGQVCPIASGSPFEPVADHHAGVLDPTILQLGEHLQPELGAFPAVAGPQPEDVTGAVDGHRESDVDGPVGDLAIADLGSVADCVMWTVLEAGETT